MLPFLSFDVFLHELSLDCKPFTYRNVQDPSRTYNVPRISLKNLEVEKSGGMLWHAPISYFGV